MFVVKLAVSAKYKPHSDLKAKVYCSGGNQKSCMKNAQLYRHIMHSTTESDEENYSYHNDLSDLGNLFLLYNTFSRNDIHSVGEENKVCLEL